MTLIGNFIRSFVRSQRGSSAVELAFILPMILALTLGAFDFGLGYFEKVKLAAAARAGVQYAMHNNFSTDEQTRLAVEQSVRDDAGDDGGALTVAANYFCECDDGTAIVCTDSCPGNVRPFTFVRVSVQTLYEPLFNYPGVPETITIREQVDSRIN